LFEAQNLSSSTRPIERIDEAATRRLRSSLGAELLRDYWGSYVAIVPMGEGFAVIADPTSAIPCFVCEHGAVTLIFSHLERCPFIDRRRFTINDAFVARVLAYDKIQNGETGLNEVRELLGGERLRLPQSADPPELVWDPRRIARDVYEPRLKEAADELRHITRSVVSAWAQGCDSISLNLSGGLDSSIVLACLARAPAVRDINAMHFRLDSSDPPEEHYAQAMANHVGCDLVQVLESPALAIPRIDEHPPTVRPYRQFVTQDMATRMGDLAGEMKHVLFTGQGGDHLFLETRSALGFADHLCHHGLTRVSGTRLLEAARLSEQSIWMVLHQSLPYWIGKTHKNSMVSNIEMRKTTVNRHAFEALSIEHSLPIWTRDSAGVPPAKYDQLSSLAHMFHVREPLDKASRRDTIHPLVSQPLIEFCLRLPTYLLCAHGRSRGLAKQAFADDLPETICRRSSKGDASRFFLAYLKANSGTITDALYDGELVARGLITRSDVEAFMRRNDYQIQISGRMMLLYYAVEAWLQTWNGSSEPRGGFQSLHRSSSISQLSMHLPDQPRFSL
jgi:asparagine synthase (glutamine-hydrolysing)